MQKVEDRNTQLESDMSEAELVARAQVGDIEAFKVLFDAHYMRLRLATTRILGNGDDAEDICQDAFLKAFKGIQNFKGESAFYTWIYRIARNLIIDFSRKASRRYERAGQEDYIFDKSEGDPIIDAFHGHVENQEQAVYSTQVGLAIGKALDELSPAHRAVIVLREYDGLSYEEIGKTLHCSVGTVMSRLHHARKKLVDLLGKSIRAPMLVNE